ncbi:hypothetical protein [Amycolatopsis sp. H20-H5]|uniref:hypothetical protein n=1 Tax=Amycolatopsis sp. H20-H5 TaxID=3046309 RepID=UPI002DBEC9DE|nr:hypothetical protein [Amycolatopsis sp. H20-H5]MEC3982795.1 hypothetical protein [Amycolatopsis sp. H20-H5]
MTENATELTVDAGVAALFGQEHRADPYPFYRQWRERQPVTPIADGVLLASGHREAAAVLRDPAFGHTEPEDLSDAPPEVLAGELVEVPEGHHDGV